MMPSGGSSFCEEKTYNFESNGNNNQINDNLQQQASALYGKYFPYIRVNLDTLKTRNREVEFYILLVFDAAYQITNEKSVLENANTGAKAIQASTLLELGKMSAESAMEIAANTEVTQENWTQVLNQIVTCKAMTRLRTIRIRF